MQPGATPQLVRTRWSAVVLGALSATLSWQVLQPMRPFTPEHARWARVASPSLSEPAEPVPQREGLFEVTANPDGAALKLPGDMRCGEAEMGNSIPASVGRYAIAGPRDNPDPHLSRPVYGQGSPTAPSVHLGLGEPLVPLGSAGPTAPFGRKTALGTDERSAQGRMWGDDPNGQWGEYGLGLAGAEGSVAKRFDVAPLPENQTAELRVVHTGLQVTGARKASEVGRTMAAHFSEFRACGQATMSNESDAQRSIVLGFDVLASGQTTARSVTSASGAAGAGSSALEQCLELALASVTFASGEAGDAHVVYPLHFAAASSGLKNRGVPSPVTRERCDCGG